MQRREFIRNLGIAAAGASAATLVPGCRTSYANDLINIGMIGTGSHGTSWNLKYYLQYPGLLPFVM